jgi:hypothetical protein
LHNLTIDALHLFLSYCQNFILLPNVGCAFILIWCDFFVTQLQRNNTYFSMYLSVYSSRIVELQQGLLIVLYRDQRAKLATLEIHSRSFVPFNVHHGKCHCSKLRFCDLNINCRIKRNLNVMWKIMWRSTVGKEWIRC